MAHMSILSDVTGLGKFKMADTKTGSTYISASIQYSIKILTAKPIFLGSRNRMAQVPILSDVTGSKKFKMAADKPEVLISRLLDKIASKFQRQSLCFRGPETEWHWCRYCPM